MNKAAMDRLGGMQQVTARIWDRDVTFTIADSEDPIQSHHLRGEFHEAEELDIIRQFCRFGSVFVDIGANVGNHSLFVGLYLRPERIIPFEVDPAAIALLTTNLEANGLAARCELDHLGIGLAERKGRGGRVAAPDQDPEGARMVRLRRGDAFLAERRVDFIKIAADGMEMRVLQGLSATIAASKPRLFVEVDNTNRAEFLAWIEDNGYLMVDRFQRYLANERFMLVSENDPVLLWRYRHAEVLERRRQRKLDEQGKGEGAA
jgi:methyltransferase, FkbM family